MKIPVKPPDSINIFAELFSKDPEAANRVLSFDSPTDAKGRYLHWDKLQYIQPPEGLTSEQWWAAMKIARRTLYKEIPCFDKEKGSFKFTAPDCVQRQLHWLDQNAGGSISGDLPIANPHIQNMFLVRSLINEAIESSRLEGAATTRQAAKEMLRQRRKPIDKDEQMISNNYRAMEFIREQKSETLTTSFILQLHKVLTEKTLDNPARAGNFRKKEDNIIVSDARDGTLLHDPPEASELPFRMEMLCAFANAGEEEIGAFVHPIIKAIVLHFMLGYDHPFVDGNGRVARALFYWYMARKGYWMMEFISISSVIKSSPGKYKRAYLYSETDDNDLTYFVIYQLEVIKQAVSDLMKYLERQSKEIVAAEKLLASNIRLSGVLNYRQLALLKHALKHPNCFYSVGEHKKSHGISHETARKDLIKMADDLNLLTKRKIGKGWLFISPADLKERLE